MKRNLTNLIAAATILLLSFGAKAQGGLAPLVGSTHVYTVNPESGSNTLAWTVLEGSDGTEYDIISGETSGSVTIKWNTTGTYTVQFTETDVTTNCETIKNATVIVSANTFDVSSSDPTTICNAADGQVNYTGTNATTGITFKVDMTTANSGFSPNWEITFTLNGGTATIADVAATEGTLSGYGPYTLTGISSNSGDATVDITMDVTGGVYAAQNVVLTLTSAKELTYNTPDKDSDDWTTTQTINAIPQTSTILTD